jgi:hypothetical protein
MYLNNKTNNHIDFFFYLRYVLKLILQSTPTRRATNKQGIEPFNTEGMVTFEFISYCWTALIN